MSLLYIYPHFFRFFSHIGHYRVLNSFLCYTVGPYLFICFIFLFVYLYSSMYMSIPVSLFIPLPPPYNSLELISLAGMLNSAWKSQVSPVLIPSPPLSLTHRLYLHVNLDPLIGLLCLHGCMCLTLQPPCLTHQLCLHSVGQSLDTPSILSLLLGRKAGKHSVLFFVAVCSAKTDIIL